MRIRPGVVVLTVLALAASGTAALSPSALARPTAPGHTSRLAVQAKRQPQPAARQRAAGRAGVRIRSGHTATAGTTALGQLRAGRNGNVTVSVGGNPATVAARASALGGRVLTHAGAANSVLIAKSRVAELSEAGGVTSVQAPVRAVASTSTSTSEGVARSAADAWQSDQPTADDGTGVSIGIVDVGFTGLSAAQTAGDLPMGTSVVNENCIDTNGTPSTDTDDHGTAVAEIAHEMAPGATLELYCVADTIGFGSAEADIVANHPEVKIVSSSLGFPLDSRGDGTGSQSGAGITAAGVVEKARKAGVLWIQSAGNDAENHWGGTLADADQDQTVDLDGVYNPNADQYEDDITYVAPGSTNAPSYSSIELQWDQWPTSTSSVTLAAQGYQCTTAFQSDGSCGEYPIDLAGNQQSTATLTAVSHSSGTSPTAELKLTNTVGFDQYWVVVIVVPSGGYPSVRYDLRYSGDVDGPSYLACSAVSNSGYCTAIDPRSYQESITSPANSPYALAVGAANVGYDGTTAGTLELFSSQGPTIDGRTKPDITAWDGVSSPVYGPASTSPSATTGFYGTSAAAPHVAGAAALALQADPALDAAQLQNFLEQRASRGTGTAITASPYNPANNQFGHGLLTLGATPSATPVTAPAGSRYQAITPKRILDTRAALPPAGNKGALTSGAIKTITVPGLPSDATAVAINLTGTGATAGSVVTAFAGGTTVPNTSNLNLSKTDGTAAVFATVRVASNHTISIRNVGSTVNVVIDELGYFGTGSESGRYAALRAPTRVLDTRTSVGGHHSKLAAGKTVTVTPGAPAGATAAVVNLTVASIAKGGYLSAAPACSNSVSSLNFGRYTRANLAIVTLNSARKFCIQNGGGAVDVIVDVVGFLGTAGSRYYPLASPQRIVDTRSGNGGSGGGRSSAPLAPNTTTAFYGANVGDVPASATALLTGVLEASTTAGQYLAVFPGTTRPTGLSSTVNFSAGRAVANAAIVGLPTNPSNLATDHVFGVYNNAGATQAAIDVAGYFA